MKIGDEKAWKEFRERHYNRLTNAITKESDLRFLINSAVDKAKEDILKEWDKLMDKTNLLHDLECGSCDKEVEDFVKMLK